MWMKGTKFRSFVGIPSVPNHQVISLAQIFIKDKLLLVSWYFFFLTTGQESWLSPKEADI